MSNGSDNKLKTDQFLDATKDMNDESEKAIKSDDLKESINHLASAFKYSGYALKHLYSKVGDNVTMDNIKNVHSKLHYGSRMSVIKDIGIIAGVVFTLLKIYKVL